jgi:PrgI family protein
VSAPRERVRLPADVEMEDRLAWGLTARQLVILAATALACYAIFTVAGTVLPAPVAVVLALPFALIGVALAVGHRDGMTGDRLALAAARHLARPSRRVSGPRALPARLPGAPAQPSLSLLRVPVKAILASGVVELADGGSALLLAATGTSWALRSEDEQAALAEAYARWLNSLAEAASILVRSVPVDLTGRASAIEDSAVGLPHPALAACARDYARFLAGIASEGEGPRRRQILLVLVSHGREREGARSDLQRRGSESTGLLRAAGVSLQALDGKQAAAVLLACLEPPGPPAGSHLDGVIHGC